MMMVGVRRVVVNSGEGDGDGVGLTSDSLTQKEWQLMENGYTSIKRLFHHC
jgi:hypothetical protein